MLQRAFQLRRVQERQITAKTYAGDDDHRDHAGGEPMFRLGGQLLLLFLVSELEQMVVSRALLRVPKDLAGAHDLAEFLGSVGIAWIEIGMNAFDGPTECDPKALGVVARQRAEHIVQRLHHTDSRLLYSLLFNSLPNCRREFVVENRALML